MAHHEIRGIVKCAVLLYCAGFAVGQVSGSCTFYDFDEASPVVFEGCVGWEQWHLTPYDELDSVEAPGTSRRAALADYDGSCFTNPVGLPLQTGGWVGIRFYSASSNNLLITFINDENNIHVMDAVEELDDVGWTNVMYEITRTVTGSIMVQGFGDPAPGWLLIDTIVYAEDYNSLEACIATYTPTEAPDGPQEPTGGATEGPQEPTGGATEGPQEPTGGLTEGPQEPTGGVTEGPQEPTGGATEGPQEPTVGPTEGPQEPTGGVTEGPQEPTGGATEGPQEPTVGPTEGPQEPTGGVTEGPQEPTGVATEGPQEPTGGPTEGPQEPTGGPTEGPQEPTGGATEGPQEPTGGVTEGPQEPTGGVTEGPQEPTGGVTEGPQEPTGGPTEGPQEPTGGATEAPQEPTGGATEEPLEPTGGATEDPQDPGGVTEGSQENTESPFEIIDSNESDETILILWLIILATVCSFLFLVVLIGASYWLGFSRAKKSISRKNFLLDIETYKIPRVTSTFDRRNYNT